MKSMLESMAKFSENTNKLNEGLADSGQDTWFWNELIQWFMDHKKDWADKEGVSWYLYMKDKFFKVDKGVITFRPYGFGYDGKDFPLQVMIVATGKGEDLKLYVSFTASNIMDSRGISTSAIQTKGTMTFDGGSDAMSASKIGKAIFDQVGEYVKMINDRYKEAQARYESTTPPANATKLDEAGNPYHDADDGKFTSPEVVNQRNGGSWSLRGSKAKLKKGKKGQPPKKSPAPSVCGQDARDKGGDIRCWDGTIKKAVGESNGVVNEGRYNSMAALSKVNDSIDSLDEVLNMPGIPPELLSACKMAMKSLKAAQVILHDE